MTKNVRNRGNFWFFDYRKWQNFKNKYVILFRNRLIERRVTSFVALVKISYHLQEYEDYVFQSLTRGGRWIKKLSLFNKASMKERRSYMLGHLSRCNMAIEFSVWQFITIFNWNSLKEKNYSLENFAWWIHWFFNYFVIHHFS